jgi:hypothetical protein
MVAKIILSFFAVRARLQFCYNLFDPKSRRTIVWEIVEITFYETANRLAGNCGGTRE